MEFSKEFIDLITKVLKNRALIIKVALVGAAFGLVVALSLPKTFVARTSFAPESEQRLGSGVSSLASMMGANFDTSMDAISVDMFPYVVSSTPFVFKLFDLPVQTVAGEETTLLEFMKNNHKEPWWSHVKNAPFKLIAKIKKLFKKKNTSTLSTTGDELDIKNLPGKERSVVRYFAQNLIILSDKKSGRVDLSLEMQDPLVAATVLEAVVESLKEYMTDYRSAKERDVIENLEIIAESRKLDYYKTQQVYADFLDANKNIVSSRIQADQLKLQQEMQLAYNVYSHVATQLESARVKELQAKPVFVVLEPVSIPRRPTGPGAMFFMILFAMMTGFVALVWVLFGKDLYNKCKNNL